MIKRVQRATEAQRLRDEGLIYREIGRRMGISRSYACELIRDPTGQGEKARKASYGGTCRDCGAPTDGSDGRANAPERCARCSLEKQHNERYWTKEVIVAAIIRWDDTFSQVPRASDWNVAMARKYTDGQKRLARYYDHPAGPWPAASMVQREFGSWSAAIRAAGLEPFAKSPPGPNTLTAEKLAETIRLYRSGLSAAQVGERLGITGDAVWQRLVGAGEPRRASEHVISDATRVAAVRRYALGESCTAIGRSLGISPTTVLKYARRAGVPIRPPRNQKPKHTDG